MVHVEIRCLPRCPFTFRAYTTEIWGCGYRLGVFKLLIDDYIKFFNYEDFDVIYANINFRRVYSQIPDSYLLLQHDHELQKVAFIYFQSRM